MSDYHSNDLCFVADSTVHGRGLFARNKISANTWIGHYDGPQTSENGMHVLWVDEGEDGDDAEEQDDATEQLLTFRPLFHAAILPRLRCRHSHQGYRIMSPAG